MSRQSATITTLPRSPEADRRARMIHYTVTMVIRLICIALCLVVQGWWLLVFAAGAIFLPYIAVILANAVDSKVSNIESPGSSTPMIESSISDRASGSEETPVP